MAMLPPSPAIAFGFPASLRTRPWTWRRSGRGAAPGLSRYSTPPDPPNHTHNRMPDLHGGGLGTTEPLHKSRCCLLLVFDRTSDVKISIPRRQTAVCSQLLMLTKLMQKARGEGAPAQGLSHQVHPLPAYPRSLLYDLGVSLGPRRRNVRQPRLSAHNVGAVFVNTPDT